MQSVPITTNVVSSNPAHGEVYSTLHHMIKLSVICGRSVVFARYFGYLHQLNWQPQYNWNIVESGIKHNKPKPKPSCNKIFTQNLDKSNLASHCYLTPTQQFLATSWWEQGTFLMTQRSCPLCTRSTCLIGFFSASSLKQQSVDGPVDSDT